MSIVLMDSLSDLDLDNRLSPITTLFNKQIKPETGIIIY